MVPGVVNAFPGTTGITPPNRNATTRFGYRLPVGPRKGDGAFSRCVTHGSVIAHSRIKGLPADLESWRGEALRDVVPYGRLARDNGSARRHDLRVVTPEPDDLFDFLALSGRGSQGLVGTHTFVSGIFLTHSGATEIGRASC